MRLSLQLLGLDHNVSVDELEPVRSPHTGRPLRQIRVGFRVPAEESHDVTEAMNRARDLDHALSTSDGQRWVVAASSYSYENGDRFHSHYADLRQVEELRAERLELLGLKLVPTRYKEEAEVDDTLLISARIDPDPTLGAELEQEIVRERGEAIYFDVLRVGVVDTPIRMRFGRCLWQKTPGGRAHLLRLVSESGDSQKRRSGYAVSIYEPEFSVAARKAAAAEGTIEALIEELQTAGTLSEKAVERIRARADAGKQKRDRDFDEARDLDRYF